MTRGVGRDPVIASVSLAAIRRFQMKHRRREARVALDLPPGSLGNLCRERCLRG
jgi:alkylated DNA repair dioxygenase AlkB